MTRDGALRYRHKAMATIFELMIAGEDEPFAAGAANEAFALLDRLEQDLSRFLPNSDISRINNLDAGGSVQVSADTFECLRLSARFHRETGGAFDMTLGSLKDLWAAKSQASATQDVHTNTDTGGRRGMNQIDLEEATMTVHVRGGSPQIDLGAIGKGYAVDCAAELLREWGVASALVHGGTSSVYGFGEYLHSPGWPVTLSHPSHGGLIEKAVLNDRGLGGSGISKGRHIIDPRTGIPADARLAAWVFSESACRSDALSTACMVLPRDEIARLIGADPRLGAVIVEREEVIRFGPPEAP